MRAECLRLEDNFSRVCRSLIDYLEAVRDISDDLESWNKELKKLHKEIEKSTAQFEQPSPNKLQQARVN